MNTIHFASAIHSGVVCGTYHTIPPSRRTTEPLSVTCKSCIGTDEYQHALSDYENGNPRTRSDGSTASYYQLPEGATELQDLISHRNMNSQIGEIFRSAYRYGLSTHSDQLRDARKIKFYIDAEIKRLENANG